MYRMIRRRLQRFKPRSEKSVTRNALARVAQRIQNEHEETTLHKQRFNFDKRRSFGSLPNANNIINVLPLNSPGAFGAWTSARPSVSSDGLVIRLNYADKQAPHDVAQSLLALKTQQAMKKTGQKLTDMNVKRSGSSLNVTLPRGASVKLPERLVHNMLDVNTNRSLSMQDILNWYKADKVRMGNARSVNQIINVLAKRRDLEQDTYFLTWKQQARRILEGVQKVSKTPNHSDVTLEGVLKENMTEYLQLEELTYTSKELRQIDVGTTSDIRFCYLYTFKVTNARNHARNHARNNNARRATYHDAWIEKLAEQKGFDERLNQVEHNIDRILEALILHYEQTSTTTNLNNRAKVLFRACKDARLHKHPMFRECAGFPMISTSRSRFMGRFRLFVRYAQERVDDIEDFAKYSAIPASHTKRQYLRGNRSNLNKAGTYLAWPSQQESYAYYERHPVPNEE